MEHQKHPQGLRERQRLLVTGPFADGTGGAYVIQAVTMEEAERTVGEDPACRAKGMEAEIREWNVAYTDFQTSK